MDEFRTMLKAAIAKRKAAGQTIRAVAAEIGGDHSTLANVIAGRIRPPPRLLEGWSRLFETEEERARFVKLGCVIKLGADASPTLLDRALSNVANWMVHGVSPVMELGEPLRAGIVEKSLKNSKHSVKQAGAVGVSDNQVGTWNRSDPGLVINLKLLFPIGPVRLVQVIDGSGGAKFPPGTFLAICDQSDVSMAKLNEREDWVAYEVLDGSDSGLAILHVDASYNLRLDRGDGRILEPERSDVVIRRVYATVSVGAMRKVDLEAQLSEARRTIAKLQRELAELRGQTDSSAMRELNGMLNPDETKSPANNPRAPAVAGGPRRGN